MSWTLPVSANQYMDYQNRLNGVRKSSRYTMERANPVVQDGKPETFERYVQDRLAHQASLQLRERKQADKKTPFDRQTYSLLTGKGRHIDMLC